MKNSAFAVNPCPRDLLGKQWLFMHMSAHYRKMFSAQSVVDSAAPASMKARTATPRSASKPVRLSQKPSRADTDPGPGTGSTRPRGGARDTLDGRASSASTSRRQIDYGASVLRKPASLARPRHTSRRDPEPGTYYDKLNQLVPDQRSSLRTSGQFLSEVFTHRVPHKPQVLRTEVPSRLRFSSTYCPPRTKPLHSKPGVQGQEIGTDAVRPMWTASSPPVSSRDSAYNGGISSGGESRGPTPDQAGVKKHSKRSEKKGKKKADPKRPYSADTKIRRKVENKFMKKLLEDERNELHEQRLRVDPWHGINQDDHGDAILRNIDDLHIEDHVDDSLTEHDSTANTDSVSGQSIEEDMVEEVDESVEVESTKEANGEDSVITDKSSASVAGTEGSVPSQSLAKSSPSPNMQQTSTQTDPPAQNNDPKVLSSGSQYPSPTHSGSISTKQSMSRSSTSGSSNKSLSTEKNRETKKPQLESKVIKEVSASLSSAKESNSKKDEKLENNQYLVNNRQNDMSYARLVNMITKDVLERRVVTYKALKAICDEHIEANCDKLDKERMQQEVDKLQIQLEIPRDDHVDCLNYVADLPKREKIPFTSKFIPSLVDVDRFALLSGPPPMAEDSPFRSTGLHSQKLIGALDSWKKPLFVNAEDSPLQHENLKLDRVKENTFFSADPTKTTSSPSLIDPVETVNDVSPPMQNDQISSFTPQSYGAQFLRDNFNKAEKLLDVADDSKKLSSPVISTKGIESFKYLKSSPLLENEYLNHLPASADDFSVIPNTMEGQSTSGSTANAVPCACKERKCRCCASDDFESYWKTYMEKSSTMQLFTGLSLGHLNDWNERANLNIEMENSIKEIEKELRQTGFHREEVSTPVIAERDEPEVVELFHSEKVRSAASEHNSLTSTIQSAIKDKFDSAPLEDKGSPDITHEQPNADGTIDSKSKLQSNPLIENSSSIPFGTGQNSDILRLKLW